MTDQAAEGPYAGSVGSMDSPTSKAAADEASFAAALRAKIFDVIKHNGGCTRGELFDLFGGVYQGSTISARITELQIYGSIRDSGAVRFYKGTERQHTVWVTTDLDPRSILLLKKSMGKLLDRFGNPISDSYCTPRWLTSRLPLVDLDPCSNPRSTVRARRRYSLELRLDGLKLPWVGSVFVNWPYSDPLPWAQKLREEMAAGRCTQAIVLCKHDSSTEWWRTLVMDSEADQWAFFTRIQFDEPEALVAARIEKFVAKGRSASSGEKSSNNFCSTIIHHRGAAPALSLGEFADRWVRVAA